jgi:metal-sulfur cluster biosynthetic enzyme
MPDELGQVILDRLAEIQDPCSVGTGTPLNLVEMGLVESVDVAAEGRVTVRLRLTTPTCNMLGFMAEEACRRISGLPGVREVEVISDQGLDWSPSLMSPEALERRRQRLEMLASRTPRPRDPTRRPLLTPH